MMVETRQAWSLQQELVRSEFGNYSKTSEGREEAEILDAQAQPLQDLRTSKGQFTEVWPVPSVFPATGAAGRDPRSFEVVLVRISRGSSVGSRWPTADDKRLTIDRSKLLTGSPVDTERTGGFRRSKR